MMNLLMQKKSKVEIWSSGKKSYRGSLLSHIALLVMAGSALNVSAQSSNDAISSSDSNRQLMSSHYPKDVRAPIFVVPIKHLGVPVKTSLLKDGATLPFAQGLRQLAPEGWSAWEGNDFVGTLPTMLKWTAGKTWFDSLGDALFAESLTADIDWKAKRIILHSQPGISSTATSPSQTQTPTQSPTPTRSDPANMVQGNPPTNRAKSALAGKRNGYVPEVNAGERVVAKNTFTSVEPATVMANTSTSVGVTSGNRNSASALMSASKTDVSPGMDTASEVGPARWQLQPGDVTIRAALTRWSAAAKWSMVFEGQNYAFETPLEIEAEFREAVCVVVAGVNAAIEQDPQAPSVKKYIDAAFWPGNKVIRVFTERPELIVAAPEGSCRRPLGTLRSPASTVLAQGTGSAGVGGGGVSGSTSSSSTAMGMTSLPKMVTR